MQRRRGWLPSPRICDYLFIGVPAFGGFEGVITNVTAFSMLDDVSSLLSDSHRGY